MKRVAFEFAKTNSFSSLFLDYINDSKKLEKFHSGFPRKKNFEALLDAADIERTILADVLTQQYQHIKLPEEVNSNIALLKQQQTFTVTTGHQLNLFTGPLFFIYKIITTINLCKHLQKTYPEYHFVPVYWMATEDHDFEEINHFFLNGSRFTWQQHEDGAVGRMSTEGFDAIFKDLPGKLHKYREIYTQQATLSESTRALVNELFGKYGLVILDADNKKLKELFREEMKAELLTGSLSDMAKKQSAALVKAGYKAQIHVRDINFFYLKDQVRQRIQKNDAGDYEILGTSITLSKEEMLKEIALYPERFSPNVVLRPLYQQAILPNIAYVGGPAEIAYWLQLKQLFEHTNHLFPILVPRNFALLSNRKNNERLQKLRLDYTDLFLDRMELEKTLMAKHHIDLINMEKEKSDLSALIEQIAQKGEKIDLDLKTHISAEGSRLLKRFAHIEKKFEKAQKRKHRQLLESCLLLKSSLFPSGQLQERHDNIFDFLLENKQLIDELLELLQPLEFKFNVLIDE